MNDIQTYVEIALGVVGLFSLIATMTPNTADNEWAQTALNFLNTLGANVGKARNGDS